MVAMEETEGTRMRENYDFTRSLFTGWDSHVYAWAKKYLTLFSGSNAKKINFEQSLKGRGELSFDFLH